VDGYPCADQQHDDDDDDDDDDPSREHAAPTAVYHALTTGGYYYRSSSAEADGQPPPDARWWTPPDSGDGSPPEQQQLPPHDQPLPADVPDAVPELNWFRAVQHAAFQFERLGAAGDQAVQQQQQLSSSGTPQFYGKIIFIYASRQRMLLKQNDSSFAPLSFG